ncbi:nucleoside hydrolase [Paroceanicella profunda]|uniref:Nucleoside hydrolase n=1 Tax=Paroceanicella profunda TaxID=2579971 RepID=A0A5B8FV94_9RHOB|nr:nucleoside hydrolase [Paroceanicella profunda]QDL91264.1 nucleoside hydrolase [Paroceanicella profunda]
MKTYIDTDPGLDDALAILAALRALELDVRGITTVAGNIGLPLTTRNAGSLVALAGREGLPVVPGAPGPLARAAIDASEIHGNDGLGAVTLPEPTEAPLDIPAADWLGTQVSEDAQILALGPLTNIAQMLRSHPNARPDRIIAMGGAIREPGNSGPKAEFNIAADPEAAAEVFASGIPLVLIPLDVTRRVRASAGWVAGLSDGPVARAAAELVSAFFQRGAGMDPTVTRPLHDPCVTIYALAPELFRGERMRLTVDLSHDGDTGALTAVPDPSSPIEVLMEVDAPGVLAALAGHLSD